MAQPVDSPILSAAGLAPSRTVLENGAVQITKSTHTTPAVTISLAVRAGSVADPPGRPGTVWLLSRGIDRGTTTRPAAGIAEGADNRGITGTGGGSRPPFSVVRT